MLRTSGVGLPAARVGSRHCCASLNPTSSVTVDPDRLQPFLRQQEHLSLLGLCISVVLTLTYFIPEHNGMKSYRRKTYLKCFQDAYISDACVVSSTERIRINAFFVDAVLIFQAKLRSRTPVSAAVCLLSSWILCAAVSAVCGVLSFQLALFPVGWKVGACLRKRISTPAYFDGNKKI